MTIIFQNKELRLTSGECISVVPHHVNKMESYFHEFKKYDMCVSTDNKRAIIGSYDGNFIESQKSNCTEAGFAFNLGYWKYEKGNTVYLFNHPGHGSRVPGGGRDFQIDSTSGKVFMKPLVLGKRADGTIELVSKNDNRALRVKNMAAHIMASLNFPENNLLELDENGMRKKFIGRKWNEKKTNEKNEWQYIDLCVTNDKKKALACSYDGQFIIADYQGEMAFGLSDSLRHDASITDIELRYMQGCTLVCVNGQNKDRTRLNGGGRDFCFYPDGQIGIKPLALGKAETEIDGVENRLVLVDPDSPQVIKLDIDYLLTETNIEVVPKHMVNTGLQSVPYFIEIKNRRIQELEHQIEGFVQENQQLRHENKKMLELESQNKKIVRENNKLLKENQALEKENSNLQEFEIENNKLVREIKKMEKEKKEIETELTKTDKEIDSELIEELKAENKTFMSSLDSRYHEASVAIMNKNLVKIAQKITSDNIKSLEVLNKKLTK